MPMIKPPHSHRQLPNAEPKKPFRQPNFACTDLPQALELKIYVPGVDASGVKITTLGTDLGIIATKPQHVRLNGRTRPVEQALRDFQLKLRLGFGYDFARLHAELADGVLTLRLPKSQKMALPLPAHQRRVA